MSDEDENEEEHEDEDSAKLVGNDATDTGISQSSDEEKIEVNMKLACQEMEKRFEGAPISQTGKKRRCCL